MIVNEDSRKNGWTQSETKPSYLAKTLKYHALVPNSSVQEWDNSV